MTNDGFPTGEQDAAVTQAVERLEEMLKAGYVHPYIGITSDLRTVLQALRDVREERHAVRNLLAVIHRDGGHYATEHGIVKAADDARTAWHTFREERDALKAGGSWGL